MIISVYDIYITMTVWSPLLLDDDDSNNNNFYHNRQKCICGAKLN